jgi:hypothetical protein
MLEDTRLIEERRADRFFLTDVCTTETYKAIQEELSAKHERNSFGELPETYFAELSGKLKDLFERCAAMCGS